MLHGSAFCRCTLRPLLFSMPYATSCTLVFVHAQHSQKFEVFQGLMSLEHLELGRNDPLVNVYKKLWKITMIERQIH